MHQLSWEASIEISVKYLEKKLSWWSRTSLITGSYLTVSSLHVSVQIEIISVPIILNYEWIN
jgi:hypothetical protein